MSEIELMALQYNMDDLFTTITVGELSDELNKHPSAISILCRINDKDGVFYKRIKADAIRIYRPPKIADMADEAYLIFNLE